MSRNNINLILLFSVILLSSCCDLFLVKQKNIYQLDSIEEVQIFEIPLKGIVSERRSELSGLCWYGNYLILLPQYLNSLDSNENGIIFYIKKDKIYQFLSRKSTEPLTAKTFSIYTSKLEEMFNTGSGFEAITINNDSVYFTIEKMNDGKTESYLISGKIDSIAKTISLDKNTLTKIERNLNINNMADESLLFYNNFLIPIYEANGINVNPNSEISVFSHDLEFIRKMKFPNIEYRITDVTSVDEKGDFWALNYFFPGERKKLNPANDDIAIKYGLGKSHFNSETVERLLKFKIESDNIKLADQKPIYLELNSNNGRNWEGIVKLDDIGFLIVTDTFPKTILAFVPYKQN